MSVSLLQGACDGGCLSGQKTSRQLKSTCRCALSGCQCPAPTYSCTAQDSPTTTGSSLLLPMTGLLLDISGQPAQRYDAIESGTGANFTDRPFAVLSDMLFRPDVAGPTARDRSL